MKISHTQINNFCFMLEKLNPAFDQQDIADYIHYLMLLLSRMDTYQPVYDSLKLSMNLFEENFELFRYIKVELLKCQYYLGDFDNAYKKLQHLLPAKEWLALDANDLIEETTFSAAASIYGNEGMGYELASYRENHSILLINYDWALIHIGVFNLELAQVCIQTSDSLYAKWAAGSLELQELNNFIDSLHPKAHIHIANSLSLKNKITRLSQDEINKLVVVNPYTQGVKHLLHALHCEDACEAKRLFQQALPELRHIKFAYTEALLEYATWLKVRADDDFELIYNEGLSSAKKYYYRFLQHRFLQLTTVTPTLYDEADYPLPNNQNFDLYIGKSIKLCKNKIRLSN